MRSSRSSENIEELGALQRLLSDATSLIARETRPSCVVFITKKTSQGSSEEVPISMNIIREEEEGRINRVKRVIDVKRLPPSSVMQVREIMVEAVSQGLISRGEKVFCLTDDSLGKGFQGLFFIFSIDDEFVKLTTRGLEEDLDKAVLDSVMRIARELASEGREGKAVGTGFVIGDYEEVARRSSQLVLNPFKGTSMERKNISDPHIKETVKEFAQIDGVFLIDDKGFVRNAGVCLNMDTSKVDLPGLGTRHHACAAVTRETDASSVCVSESGIVRVFKDGNLVMEEKAR